MQGNVWYNVDVPKSLEKKNENFSLKMPVSLLKLLGEIAEAEDRPLGYVGRELMIRGLALYQSDGRLRDEPNTHIAPVVARISPGDQQTREEIEHQLRNGGMPIAPTGRTKIPLLKPAQKPKRKAR
jgi:hypothetical protein